MSHKRSMNAPQAAENGMRTPLRAYIRDQKLGHRRALSVVILCWLVLGSTAVKQSHAGTPPTHPTASASTRNCWLQIFA